MYTVIIFGIITFIVSFLIMRKSNKEYDTTGNPLIFSMMGMIFGLIVAVMIPGETETKIRKIELANLNDRSNTSGSFFLGSGQVEGVMKYTYYYKNGDYYKMGSRDAEGVLIKYTDGPAYIEIREKKLKKGPLINKFVIYSQEPQIIIHIPEGSIKTYYNLDAQ